MESFLQMSLLRNNLLLYASNFEPQINKLLNVEQPQISH